VHMLGNTPTFKLMIPMNIRKATLFQRRSSANQDIVRALALGPMIIISHVIIIIIISLHSPEQ